MLFDLEAFGTSGNVNIRNIKAINKTASDAGKNIQNAKIETQLLHRSSPIINQTKTP